MLCFLLLFYVYLFELVSYRWRPKEGVLIERFFSLFEEHLINDFKKTLLLQPGLWYFWYNFQSKTILTIRCTFHVETSTVKFSSLFKESPRSPVVTFPSFGLEGHGAQPPQGESFFHICSTLLNIFFFNLFFTTFQTR